MFSQRTNWSLTPNPLSEALEKHRAAGKPLIDLTVSNPTKCGFEYDQEAILRALSNPAGLTYEPDPKGLCSAREAVAQYYAERDKKVSPENILLTASTSEAYSFAFRLLCNPGDEILIPSPSYPLFGFLADLHDVRMLRYPLIYDHGWQIDFYSLMKAITSRTRGVIVVHPNNPTGNYCKPQEMEKLNEICAKHSLAIVADEVFLDFDLTGPRPGSFAANTGVLTFAMSGLSKVCGLPQMKMAWVVVSGPSEKKAEALSRLEVIADTYLSVNTPVQLATPILLEQRHLFQRQLMARVRRNLTELQSKLSADARLKVEGGWYAVLRLPLNSSDEDLALKLLKKNNIYLHPGHFYDFSGQGYVVSGLILPEMDLRRALEEISGFNKLREC